MTNFKLFISFIFIICLVIISGCGPQQKEKEVKKQIDSLGHKIISLGYTTYSTNKPLNWKPLFEIYSTYDEVKSNPQKMIRFAQDLYEVLKQYPVDYPYCFYIDEKFGAGYTRHNDGQLYLQVKYGASKKEIAYFLSRYKDLYDYQKLEKKLLGSTNKEKRILGGLPLYVSPSLYLSGLDKYYDWLKFYSRHKEIPEFKDLKQINQDLGYQAVNLFLVPRRIYLSSLSYIISYNHKREKMLTVQFTVETPLNKLALPLVAQRVKNILLK